MGEELNKYVHYNVPDGPVKLIRIRVLHGANYFSAEQVVYLRINLGMYHEVYSNQIAGLYEKLIQKLPTLYEHYCSPGVPGGFLKRVKEGTLLGHILEHVAIELQTRAGMNVGYGKTRSTPEKGVYNVIFRFHDEVAGVYAGKAALNMLNAFLSERDFDVEEIIRELVVIRELRLLGPSTQAIVSEVEKRKIPYLRLDDFNLVQLGNGKYQKRIRATLTSDTGFIAVETAGNKYLTNLILNDAGLPVLRTAMCRSAEDVIGFRDKIGKPVVIKPSEGYQGKYLSPNLLNDDEIRAAYNMAAAYDDNVLVQEYHQGLSYRLLVIDFKFVAAVLLAPPYITGNGSDTIAVLIEKLNHAFDRQSGDKGKLSRVEVDEITQHILERNKYTLDTVLKQDEQLFLKYSGSMRQGGSATDVTDNVHPDNKFLAERAARAVGLNVAGVDVLSNNISVPMLSDNAVVIEVNAAPDFRMHLNPTFNKPRPVARELVNMLFPLHEKNRVPVFSITGTAGKSTAAFLLNYCLAQEGFNVGLTSTEGLFITNKMLKRGDMTEPESVALVFKDPTIDCAVLETSLEGILRRGLGYKYADYGIVLNVLEDHIGNDDVEIIDDVAYAKSVVAEEVFSSGYTILNADNTFTAEMLSRLYSKPGLFSANPAQNKTLHQHIFKGGLAVTIENNIIRVYYRSQSFDLLPIQEVPLFYGGKALFMSDAVLATVAALIGAAVHPDKIRTYLKTFLPDFQHLPGRMNFYDRNTYTLLMDYAHNKPSFLALSTFLEHFKNNKMGVFDAPGDRSDEDLIELGALAAGMFNEIVLYEGVDNRGRLTGEVNTLIIKGLLSKQFNEDKITVLQTHDEALNYITQNAHSNNFIVLLTALSEVAYNILLKKHII